MHLIEQYALSCGLKIGKPSLYDHFFPLEEKKYITLQREANFQSKQYKYWQQAVDLLHPILAKNGISIVQIGTQKDKNLKNVINTNGKTSIRQAHYLIRNSELHLGIDSFAVHIASGLGKKIVALYSNSIPENCGPYWTNPEERILIQSPKEGKKPSHGISENPKTINGIKPETIANSTLKLLGIKERVKIETLFIGEKFSEDTYFGFLPNQVVVSENAFPEIRMDLLFDEKLLTVQLSKQKSIITTDKPISEETLLKFKSNIAKVIYLIKENDDPNFVKFLFEKGFDFSCVSELPPDAIKAKKLNYYRFCSIEEILENEEHKEARILLKKAESKVVKFKTNYIFSSDRKNHLSEHHLYKKEDSKNINDFSSLDVSIDDLRDIRNFWFIKELN